MNFSKCKLDLTDDIKTKISRAISSLLIKNELEFLSSRLFIEVDKSGSNFKIAASTRIGLRFYVEVDEKSGKYDPKSFLMKIN